MSQHLSNPRFILPGILLALLTACGDSQKSGSGAPSLPDPVSSVTIIGNDRMRFAPEIFVVRAGEEVTVTLHNIGSMPKETMGHNWVLLTMGTDILEFSTAGVRHPKENYVAPGRRDQVLAEIGVLGPDEKASVTFTAPSEPGTYPFVCSFTGHTRAGMVGEMIVVP